MNSKDMLKKMADQSRVEAIEQLTEIKSMLLKAADAFEKLGDHNNNEHCRNLWRNFDPNQVVPIQTTQTITGQSDIK